jgi:hypothetical protein
MSGKKMGSNLKKANRGRRMQEVEKLVAANAQLNTLIVGANHAQEKQEAELHVVKVALESALRLQQQHTEQQAAWEAEKKVLLETVRKQSRQ